ncbi:MAG: hypothetical protein AMXMBFR58_31010 [Phycisphaerae bacterium]
MIASRRGSIYLVVLATSLMVFVLAYGAVAWASSDARARTPGRDELAARRLAASAVELALQSARNTAVWRTQAAAGNLFTDLSTGGGYVTATASDPTDGSLVDDATEPVVFTGIGRVGLARQMYTVTAAASPTYITALDRAMHAQGNIIVSSAIVRASGGISSNGSITVTSSLLRGDAEAAGTISGSLITGSSTSGVAARIMPSTDLISQYLSMATSISHSAINGEFKRCLVSGATNPFGSTNPYGVYAVNCGGKDLNIEDSRITGTIIVTNTTGVRVQRSVFMSPWESGLPVLIVDGPLTIETEALDLIESSFQNFNPVGNPYKGVTDSDLADRYPSMLMGIVYASGAITLDKRPSVVGALIGAGTITVKASAVVTVSRDVKGSPPGFVTRHFVVDSTTWQRKVD